jgi:hypothetical protein
MISRSLFWIPYSVLGAASHAPGALVYIKVGRTAIAALGVGIGVGIGF